jgi:hypothetical protein
MQTQKSSEKKMPDKPLDVLPPAGSIEGLSSNFVKGIIEVGAQRFERLEK